MRRWILLSATLAAFGFSDAAAPAKAAKFQTANQLKSSCTAGGGIYAPPTSSSGGMYNCVHKDGQITSCGGKGKYAKTCDKAANAQGGIPAQGRQAGVNERGPAIRFRQTNATASDRRVTTPPSDLGGGWTPGSRGDGRVPVPNAENPPRRVTGTVRDHRGPGGQPQGGVTVGEVTGTVRDHRR